MFFSTLFLGVVLVVCVCLCCSSLSMSVCLLLRCSCRSVSVLFCFSYCFVFPCCGCSLSGVCIVLLTALFLLFGSRHQGPLVRARTVTLDGTPGGCGVTARGPVEGGRPTHCAAASTEGKSFT